MPQLWQLLFGGIIKDRAIKIHQEMHLFQKIPAHFIEVADLMDLICDIVKNYPIIGFLYMQICRLQHKKEGVLR